MTEREKALNQVIDTLIASVEELGCTCPNAETRNRIHAAPGRRRRDSRCWGVGVAVEMDLKRRRAMRKRDKESD